LLQRHAFKSLSEKKSKSEAELIAFLVVARISQQLPVGAIIAMPPSELAPEQVYDALVREARSYLEWRDGNVERRKLPR
jgi:hypothetical protein